MRRGGARKREKRNHQNVSVAAHARCPRLFSFSSLLFSSILSSLHYLFPLSHQLQITMAAVNQDTTSVVINQPNNSGLHIAMYEHAPTSSWIGMSTATDLTSTTTTTDDQTALFFA
jgi:hypothetical protein